MKIFNKLIWRFKICPRVQAGWWCKGFDECDCAKGYR